MPRMTSGGDMIQKIRGIGGSEGYFRLEAILGMLLGQRNFWLVTKLDNLLDQSILAGDAWGDM